MNLADNVYGELTITLSVSDRENTSKTSFNIKALEPVEIPVSENTATDTKKQTGDSENIDSEQL